MCSWNMNAPDGNKLQNSYFNFSVKVMVKVIRPLTLVLFERVLYGQYKCPIWSLYLLTSKVIAKIYDLA